MKKIRFLNMPLGIWLLSVFVVVLMHFALYGHIPGNVLPVAAVITVIATWYCYDLVVPTFTDDEYLWMCSLCKRFGVVSIDSSLFINDVLMSRVELQHRAVLTIYKPCSMDADRMDVYRGPFKITALDAEIQFKVWKLLQAQRNKASKQA